jgi:histidine triad (HIT) family protein
MSDCIFCKIIDSEIPSSKVYEDEKVLAFLDINPKAKGHILVIPKIHSENIFNIQEDDLTEVMKVVKLLSQKLKDRLNPTGIYIRQNNGESVGQTVFHFHIHIIPNYEIEPSGDILEILTH